MKKIFALSISAAAVLSIFGCEDKSEIVQTVDWFKAHRPEREIVLEKCRSNPGQLLATPNCINAGKAASAITWGATGGIHVKALQAN